MTYARITTTMHVKVANRPHTWFQHMTRPMLQLQHLKQSHVHKEDTRQPSLKTEGRKPTNTRESKIHHEQRTRKCLAPTTAPHNTTTRHKTTQHRLATPHHTSPRPTHNADASTQRHANANATATVPPQRSFPQSSKDTTERNETKRNDQTNTEPCG